MKTTKQKEIEQAKKATLSEGAKFMIALKGKRCYYEGKEVCKWELWASGYTNATHLINGFSEKIKIV